MLENLKADVIYHSSNSDFEMEFNLCGCCRMRLLSDKTSDKKGLVNALAKAVSRSRVIMVCGPLFSDDGLIKIVSAAIGRGTQSFNTSEYGIESDTAIDIIKGSTPLVTTDGYFGGCIIESGPQTIILLTENRTFRKDIMVNLIHPYVEELSILPIKGGKPTVKTPEPQEVLQGVTETAENDDFITETTEQPDAEEIQPIEAAPTPEDEHNVEFIMDSPDVEEEDGVELDLPVVEDEVYNDMYLEPEAIKSIKSSYEHDYSTSHVDNIYISEVDDYDEQEAEDAPKARVGSVDVFLIVLTLLLLGAVLALCYFLFLRPHIMGISTADYIKEIFGAASSTPLI